MIKKGESMHQRPDKSDLPSERDEEIGISKDRRSSGTRQDGAGDDLTSSISPCDDAQQKRTPFALGAARRDEFAGKSRTEGADSNSTVAGPKKKEPAYVSNIQPEDVLAGRGTGPANHDGNIFFREAVERITPLYVRTPSRKTKNKLVHDLVERIKSRRGRFLRKLDDGEAEELAIGKKADGQLLQQQQKGALKEADRYNDSGDSGISPTVYELLDDSGAFEKTKQAIRYIHYKKKSPAEETGQLRRQEGIKARRGHGRISSRPSLAAKGTASAASEAIRRRRKGSRTKQSAGAAAGVEDQPPDAIFDSCSGLPFASTGGYEEIRTTAQRDLAKGAAAAGFRGQRRGQHPAQEQAQYRPNTIAADVSDLLLLETAVQQSLLAKSSYCGAGDGVEDHDRLRQPFYTVAASSGPNFTSSSSGAMSSLLQHLVNHDATRGATDRTFSVFSPSPFPSSFLQSPLLPSLSPSTSPLAVDSLLSHILAADGGVDQNFVRGVRNGISQTTALSILARGAAPQLGDSAALAGFDRRFFHQEASARMMGHPSDFLQQRSSSQQQQQQSRHRQVPEGHKIPGSRVVPLQQKKPNPSVEDHQGSRGGGESLNTAIAFEDSFSSRSLRCFPDESEYLNQIIQQHLRATAAGATATSMRGVGRSSAADEDEQSRSRNRIPPVAPAFLSTADIIAQECNSNKARRRTVAMDDKGRGEARASEEDDAG